MKRLMTIHWTRMQMWTRVCLFAVIASLMIICGCSDQKSEQKTQPKRKTRQSFTALFKNRSDAVGSPHGDLSPDAQATSPDGRFLAKLDRSRKKVELLLASTEESLGIISDRGDNAPKAFVFSPDSSQIAVLYHEDGNLNIIEIWKIPSKQPVKVIRFFGRDYYHEMVFYNEDWIALLLQWRGLGAIVNHKTEEVVEDRANKLTLPETVDEEATEKAVDKSMGQTAPKPSESQFVKVEGTQLMLGGSPFYFVGPNCYYLMTYAADADRRPHVDQVLESASQMGFKIIRTWAFNDGERHNALQTAPGEYSERGFQGLDYVIWKAEQLGLRLIRVLVNNWDDYGGINQYVQWSQTAESHDDFYTDENTKKWFRDYVSAVLNRTNTFSGKLYKDDPTILALELTNEARVSHFASQDMIQWMAEMSQHIKTLDSNHLVTTGVEGLESFVEIHEIPTIDFCTVHLWPDHWHWDSERSLTWLRDRIRDAHEIVRKPVILGEFGSPRDTTPPDPPIPTGGSGHTDTRDQFYQAVLNEIYENRAAGALFWIFYHDSYPDYDGFGVYYPDDRSTIDILRAAVVRAEALSAGDVHKKLR